VFGNQRDQRCRRAYQTRGIRKDAASVAEIAIRTRRGLTQVDAFGYAASFLDAKLGREQNS
jgi:hypothetical protein